MQISHPLQRPEVKSFFESQKESFLEHCFDVLAHERTPEITEGLLGFYEAIYLPVVPSGEKLLGSLSVVEASLVLARGWLYLINQAKYEPWVIELIQTLSSSRFHVDANETSVAPLHVKSFSFGEEAGFFIHNNILDVFTGIYNKNATITFLNLYEGVPIASEATVVEVGEDEVVFRMDPLQELAMKNDNKAYILQNEFFNKPVKADIVVCNIPKHEVTLKNFMYLLNMPAAMRDSARVHPRKATPAVLVDLEKRVGVEGIMFDISTGGLGVLSKTNEGIVAGAHVRVFLDLKEDENVSVETEAEVLDVIEYEDAYRFCMRFLPKDALMHEAVVKYVRERENEAIGKLKKQLKEYM